MLGKEVGWDQDTQTASINDKAINLNTNTSTSYDRTNPAPIGVTQSASVSNYSTDSTLEITIKEVVRGIKANEIIKQYNEFAVFGSEQGYEYIIVKLKVKVLDVKNDGSVSVNPIIFDIYTEGGAKYGVKFILPPEPRLSSKLYKGAESEGWVAYQVKTDDRPKLGYGQSDDGTGGIWYKLY
jgi:hypothetical protein